MTETVTPFDADADDVVTTADSFESAAVAPIVAPIVAPVQLKEPTPAMVADLPALEVKVEPRFGYRNVRGKPTRVPTQHLNILVDGKMHAWTFKAAGQPIFAIAEFLDHEIPQLQSAVKKFTGEEKTRVFQVNNTPTQAEVDALTR